MKKIIDFFTNKIVLGILGLISLSIIIWFWGDAISFGENNYRPLESEIARLITIMVIILLWGANNLRIQFQSKKNNDNLVEALSNSQDEELDNASDEQSREELHQIRERFDDALSVLKKLNFNKSGFKKALYELPWYVIIGPPGAGKTTALVNSGLEFPLAEKFGKGALKGIGGTRNCDWWFTNEAVLVDTAGRYVTQDSHRVADSSAWEGFLNLLKRHRTRRPINGVIVSISLQDLLIQSEEERLHHAKVIRSRIDELMEKLEIRFPIYVMFTKTDLISGFSEFFEDLNKEARSQVWGISFPNALQPTESPDFDFLEKEYQHLMTRIYDKLMLRVHQERDLKRRGVIQNFPQQMENLKPILSHFLRNTFAKNRFQHQPFLRGIYFSSGTQDGTPIDRLMTTVGKSFGFDAHHIAMEQNEGKSFFIEKLFKDVVFPEAELVGANHKYENLIRWTRRGAYAASVLLIVGFLSIWWQSIQTHKSYMKEVQAHITEFKTEKDKRAHKNLRIVVQQLNALESASSVYDKDKHMWLSSLGLYDIKVDKSANKAYAVELKKEFLPRLIQYLEKHIQQGYQGGDLYNTFKVYLMFFKLDKIDKGQILAWFNKQWEVEYHGRATDREELERHLQALLNLKLDPITLNKNMVSQVRTLLLQEPTESRIYRRIRSNPEYDATYDLYNDLGEHVKNTFEFNAQMRKTLRIPQMFTKSYYKNIDLSSKSPMISDLLNDDWVLTDDQQSNLDFEEKDLKEISKKVKVLYEKEYINVWNKVFASFTVKNFENLDDASDTISGLTHPVYSALSSILELMKEHTEITPPVLDGLSNNKLIKGKAKKAVAAASNFSDKALTPIDLAFKDIHMLLRSKGGPRPLDTILEKVAGLEEFVNTVATSPDPGGEAFKIAQARYQGGNNVITNLFSYSKKMPKPVNLWLRSVSTQSWRVILKTAHRHINSEWRSQVYEPYRANIAGRFPFKKKAQDQVALNDFADFFKPGGIIDSFYITYVKPFTTKKLNNRMVDEDSLGFFPKTLSHIKNAKKITDIFFKLDKESPGLKFKMKAKRMPEHIQGKDRNFSLEFGEYKLSFSHSYSPLKTLEWSAADVDRVIISFEDSNGQLHSKIYEGPWALLKLFNDADISSTNRSTVYVITFNLNKKLGGQVIKHKMIYELTATSRINPFSENVLTKFICPESI